VLTFDLSLNDAQQMSIRTRTDGEYSAHLQGTLDLLILRTLIFGRQHGQGIARAIQLQSDNVLIVEHGSLYPALQRLEERGFIEADWGTSENKRKARFYTLTRAGRKELAREQRAWRRVAGAIMRVLGPESGTA
jgi:transcriptional regulator